MKATLKILLPVVILLISAGGAVMLVRSRTAPEARPAQVNLPLVRIVPVSLQTLTMTVNSQGTVRPRTESVLVPEVSGTVIEVAQAFIAGGFFEKGDVLLKIDPHDYRQAVVEARARVAQAELRLSREEAEAELALREWAEIGEG